MKKQILLSVFIISYNLLNAQDVEFDWVRSFANGQGISIANDESGNVYTTGYFKGTADFDPGVGVFALTSNGNEDIFIQKLDSDGNFLWATSMGGSSSDQGLSITIDPFGNVYCTGFYSGIVDFDPGTSIFNLTESGSGDVFIQKLDSDGNFIWAKSAGSDSSTEVGRSIDTDSEGNVYVTGRYAGVADFDPSAGVFNLTTNGGLEVFVLKLNAFGDMVWAKSIGGSSYDYGQAISIDTDDNVYVTGYYFGAVDFDPNAGTYMMTSIGCQNPFVLKLDNDGNFEWARSTGGSLNNFSFGIHTNQVGEVYVVGEFFGSVDFDPGVAVFNLSSSGFGDVFIQKLDANGDFVWAKSMGSITAESGYSITSNSSGELFVTGKFSNTADFDPSVNTFNLTSNGSSDIFIQKLNDSGDFLWAKSIGGTSSDAGRSIITDDLGNVYLTGDFEDTVDFDPNAGVYNVPSALGNSVYVLKLQPYYLGIDENSISTIQVYPNPSQGNITIELGDLKEVSISLINSIGQTCYHQDGINTSEHQIDINQASGVYFVEVKSEGSTQLVRLIID